MARGRLLSLVLVSAVIASVLAALSWPSAPPGPRGTPVAEAPDAASAMRAALLQGSRVEVADGRTETRTVYADPKGFMTAELSVAPVRIRRGKGWVPVDTTLSRQPDGSIIPGATDQNLSFSGGGTTTPLVHFGKDGKEIALSWPGELPAPSLAGDTATYAEVFPGVDLVVKAESARYTQNLVIKNAEAARDPALAKIHMGLKATGLTISVTDGGELQARDSANAIVFAASPSEMWDAALPARRARVAVEVDDTSMTIIPDQALLRDPAARYPITVDPDWHTWGLWGWTTVLSGSDTPRWNCSAAGCGVAQVGYCDPAWQDPSCNGIGIARSYFQFSTNDGWLNGVRVLGGIFETVVVHSPDCDNVGRAHHLVHTAGHIDGNTKWSNAPQGGVIGTVNIPKVNATHGCGGNQTISWGVPAGEINVGDPATYFILSADERQNSSGALWWRKYDPAQTTLKVNFNRKPNRPYNLATDPPLPAPCRWCNSRSYLAQGTIRLIASLSDPDGDNVRPKWRVKANDQLKAAWDGAFQANGATHDTTINLEEGKEFGWWLHADDGYDVDDPNGMAGPGPWVVDTLAPKQKPGVTGTLYVADNRWHGGVGVPATFTFTRAENLNDPNNDTDIDHYLYGTTWPPTTSINAEGALGGPATITFTPTADGPQDLYVVGVDRAGNPSPPTVVHFYVRAGNGPIAQYSLDGNAKDTAFLGDRDGTLNGGPTFGPGAVSSAVQLSPGSYVTAPPAVHTSNSFSVSAWVKASELPEGVVLGAVSQEGNRPSAFYLNYRGDTHRTTFMLASADKDNPNGLWVQGPALTVGTWTHLTGVFDRAANRIRLYFNGIKVDDQPLPGDFVPWDGTGPLTVGREKWNGVFGNSWRGSVDEVQLYDRVLSDAEVRAIVSRDNVFSGFWKFDETEGSTARNEVDGGSSLVLSGGAAFTGKTGGAVHGGVRFDGSTGQAAASGPAVRTDQSFTVTAWVNPDQFTSAHMTAVSQEGSYNSGFSLQYNAGHQKWLFIETTADGTTYDYRGAIASQPPVAGDWTHLAGVYDAGAQELRIYVNGQFGGKTSWATPWNATGKLVVGRGEWQGGPAERWLGNVDEVRTYNRPLTEEEIRGLVVRGNVTVGTWKLDGDARDATSRHLDGTINGAVDWTGGQTSVPAPTDLAVHLAGSSHVSMGHAVDVDRGFSVAAWARIDVVGGAAKQTVVSQDGSQVSAFKLRATPEGKWSFAMFGTDSGAGGTKDEAVGGAVQAGTWTHLVGVYDASSHQISLYVNGVLAATVAHTQIWNFATGGLQLGRAKSSGSPTEYFPGAIDDVTAYSRVLFAEEIETLSGRDLTLAHNWTLDEPSGTVIGDSVGARGGTISGATHVAGKLGNALHFDGTSAGTSGVDIDTMKSFTVTAWVHLEHICDPQPECHFTAVSLDGGQTSKFRLGHKADQDNNQLGTWVFEMPEADGSVRKAAVAAEEPDLTGWVHLAGVYDARAHQIWLYVNGVRQGDGTLETSWAASGGLRLGRGREDGVDTEYWPGEVDDVRLYTGALDAFRIESLVNMYPVSGGGTPTLQPADAGQWKFDEAPGATVAADASGRGNPATLTGGPTLSGWYLGLNGTSQYAATAGPVLNTSQSFTVAAWAYMGSAGTTHRAVVGQDGNRVSAFLVEYRQDIGKWAVVVPSADSDTQTSLVLAAGEPMGFGDWQHVAVVYDANLRQLRLYVNGVLSAAQVGVTILNGTGPFSIGRGKRAGANVDFFTDSIDDVRAFGKALSDGEVRKVHDDHFTSQTGSYQFDDGTAQDRSFRANHLTLSGGTSYVTGINGRALRFDGTGSGTAPRLGVLMRDSFAVSAWAKLADKDRDHTVLGQDGSRMSGFVLQYKRSLDRWVFGGPGQDVDSVPFMYAYADAPAVVDQWVHLTGVYDYAGRQLRLYVNGKLAGTRNDVRLLAAAGGFSVGRGRYNGQPADLFAGTVDDVLTDKWMPSDEEIALRAGYPTPPPGELGRFVNDTTGARYTAVTGSPIQDGFRFERSLGLWAPAGPNTTTLFSCQTGTDVFSSTSANCDGGLKLGELGPVWTVQPTNLATIRLYRCRSATDVFESLASDCDGATQETVLGFVPAYGLLARYVNPTHFDHISTTYDAYPGYRYENVQGWLSKLSGSGTTPLLACRDGSDYFLSVDAACDGKTVLGTTGHIWTAAQPGFRTSPLFSCAINGERFVSLDAACEGFTVVRQLGYVMTSPRDITPQFP